jgi:hypothetical protein
MKPHVVDQATQLYADGLFTRSDRPATRHRCQHRAQRAQEAGAKLRRHPPPRDCAPSWFRPTRRRGAPVVAHRPRRRASLFRGTMAWPRLGRAGAHLPHPQSPQLRYLSRRVTSAGGSHAGLLPTARVAARSQCAAAGRGHVPTWRRRLSARCSDQSTCPRPGLS